MNIAGELYGYSGHPGGGCVDVFEMKFKPGYVMVQKAELSNVKEMVHLVCKMSERINETVLENKMATAANLIDQMQQELLRIEKYLELNEI